MLLSVRVYGDPVLREKCRTVETIDDEIKKLIDNMAQTMYAHKGVGLAAPQVGIKKRVIIIDVGEGLLSFVNPVISARSEKCGTAEEGCLSLPGIHLPVKRAETITIEGLGGDGQFVKLERSALAARALQHEVDHLGGTLIIDYIGLARRQLIKGRLRTIENMKEAPIRNASLL